MGSSWSKLKRAVEKGEETRALELYTKSGEIRRKLNANAVLNEYTLDTYMHTAARHGMHELLKLLLYENGGNPNKTNRHKQTVLHKVCEGTRDAVQYECMQLLLQWHDPSVASTSQLMLAAATAQPSGPSSAQQPNTPHLNNTNMNTSNNLVHNSLLLDINVNAKDDADNTPLHYAAMRNLATCVQTLVAHGAFLFVENSEHSTPCDLAEKYGNKDIALYLESKMIFSKDDDEKENAEDEQEVAVIEEKHNFGLRIQDLQEEKDKLLVETADMLRCSIFTAEILLKKHAWSKQNLLNAWIEDPIKCCEKCGISTDAINNALLDTNKSPQSPNTQTSETISGGGGLGRIRQLEQLDSNSVIARKLSGRYMTKKKESTSSLLAAATAITNGGNTNQSSSASSSAKLSDSSNTSLAVSTNKLDTAAAAAAAARREDNDTTKESTSVVTLEEQQRNQRLCPICMTIECDDNVGNFFGNNCGHRFCRSCWDNYLTMKIDEGAVIDIVCPQVDCFAIIPPQVVESLISKETAQRYLHFDLKAFVESNPSIKWCPYPGCGMAVKNPKLLSHNLFTNDNSSSTTTTTTATQQQSANSTATANDESLIPLPSSPPTKSLSSPTSGTSSDYSLSVDCGNGHYFCWECLQEGHEPASCASWRAWFQKIAEIKPEELCSSTSARSEESSANYLWLVTHSKRCPNPQCQAPIQKNEGCNHVKCYRCKHDFCWICLEPWKKHSSATGGYFQCNRYEASSKILQKERSTVADAEEMHLKAVELNKFVHYYTRFKNHEHSYKIEEPLLALAKQKFEILTAAQQQQQQNSTSRSQNSVVIDATAATGTTPTSSSELPNGHNETTPRRTSASTSSMPININTPPLLAKAFSIKKKFEKSTNNSSNNSGNSMDSSSPSKMTGEKYVRLSQSFDKNEAYRAVNEKDEEVVEGVVKSSSDESKSLLNDDKQHQQQPQQSQQEDQKQQQQQQQQQSTDVSSPPPYQFIEDAIRELLKARRILRCSYVYGYYLDTAGSSIMQLSSSSSSTSSTVAATVAAAVGSSPHKKFIFEFVQTEFEECTENLSQCIARPHLKTPKARIVRLTNMLRRKRLEFVETITRGLNTFNDTPPTLKKYSRQRWKYLLKDNIQNDDEFKNTIALSLKELNPKNPWIVDKKGRHTNLLALLDDWPELERDLERILVSSKDKSCGVCTRSDCSNVRAVNTLSGSLCNYCSIRCMRLDHNSYLETKKQQQQQSQQTPLSTSSSSQSQSPSLLSTQTISQSAPVPVPVTSKKSIFTKKQQQRQPTTKKKATTCVDLLSDDDEQFVSEDTELIRAIELSRFQQIIENDGVSKSKKTFENDMKRAIELSLLETSAGNKAKTSAHPKEEAPLCSNNDSSLIPKNSNSHLAVAAYEPFYLSASSNEKDVAMVLKNVKSVVYANTTPEQTSQRKTSKVYAFATIPSEASTTTTIRNDESTNPPIK